MPSSWWISCFPPGPDIKTHDCLLNNLTSSIQEFLMLCTIRRPAVRRSVLYVELRIKPVGNATSDRAEMLCVKS